MTDLAVAVTVSDSAGLKTSATSTITVTTPSQTSIKIGQTTVGPINDSGNGNGIIGQSAVLTQASTIQTLSIYVAGIGGQVRLGLYSGATSPGAKVAETAAFTPVVGWNTQQTLTTPTLAAGQYWLVNHCQSNALALCKASVTYPAYNKALAFGTLPATFPTSPNTENSLWSVYGTFAVAPPVPPDPNAPVVPVGIGLSSISVGPPPNANTVVGVVSVTTADGRPYVGKVTLGGADAAKFVLSNGGTVPCNVMVGSTDIPAGAYNINLTTS